MAPTPQIRSVMRRSFDLLADAFSMRFRGEAVKPLPLFLALAVLLQVLGGAYRSEFGGYPDEAGHYVTGLLVRDYLAGGFLRHPGVFAREYYRHYPKVALGHWPPGFYILQAAWTLPFGPSRVSVLVLMALSAAAAACLIRLVALRLGCRPWLAFGAGCLYLCLPTVQAYTGMVMTENTIAFLALAAALSYARYLDRDTIGDGVLFGLLASFCILTKGTGVFLAAVPPLAVILCRRLRLLRTWGFWLPLGVVVILAGPWTWATMALVRDGWAGGGPSTAFTAEALRYYPARLLRVCGLPVALTACAGLARLRRPAGDPAGALPACVFATAAGVLLLHVFVPCGLEERHLIPAAAVVVVLSAWGVEGIAGRTARLSAGASPGNRRVVAAALALGLAFAGFTFRIPRKGYEGFRPVARELLDASGPGGDAWLVSSDARGEGMFISEVAMAERRPGHVVNRASKLLARSGWSGVGYESRAATPGELLEILEAEGVGVVILDASVPERLRVSHHALLERTVAERSNRFDEAGVFDIVREGTRVPDAIRVYRLMPGANRPGETP